MLLPIGRAEEKARATSVIVYALIIANVYLVCGLAATSAQIWMGPDSVIPALGASGAIAGVLGAYLRMFPSNRIRVLAPLGWLIFPIRLPAVVVIGFWIALQFFDEFISITGHNAQTLNGGVAYMAHIGGFLTGLALSFLWQRKEGIDTGDMKYL